MVEQERRAAYCKLTGRIATSDQSGYFAFCKGLEHEREECAVIAENFSTADGYEIAYSIRERSNV